MYYCIASRYIISYYLDINECDDGNNGGCQHTCINGVGTYHCQCLPGYTLLLDGRSCQGSVQSCGAICNACFPILRFILIYIVYFRYGRMWVEQWRM